MGTQFSGTVFVLLWGVPFLVAGQGLSPAVASALLTVFVVAGLAIAPVIGELTARHPLRRSWLVLTIIGLNAASWTVVLLTAPPVPLWLLVVLVVVLAAGAPGSMVGFDYARTFNPGHRQGTAVGIVNVGGFSASVLVVLVVGPRVGRGRRPGSPATGADRRGGAGRPPTRTRRIGGPPRWSPELITHK
jgi:MFS family permease